MIANMYPDITINKKDGNHGKIQDVPARSLGQNLKADVKGGHPMCLHVPNCHL